MRRSSLHPSSFFLSFLLTVAAVAATGIFLSASHDAPEQAAHTGHGQPTQGQPAHGQHAAPATHTTAKRETHGGVVGLDVAERNGVLHVLTTVRAGDGFELRHQRSTDAGRTWSTPVTIPSDGRPPGPVHRGNEPQLAVNGDRLVVVWTRKGNSRFGAGAMASARSEDGGRTWTAGPNPAGADLDSQSFSELLADGAGAFHVFWLDTREDSRGLRVARSTDAGRSWAAAQTIDVATCECCWNKAIALDASTLAVLYRDRQPRDMALAIAGDDGRTWQRQSTVGDFKWAFEGCPHVGGGLAVTRDGAASTLHALVWSGDERHQGVSILSSSARGAIWSQPVRIGGPMAMRGDLAADGTRLAAVWDASTDDGNVIMSAESRDGAKTWTTPAQVSGAASATHPLIVATQGRFVAFWTEVVPGTKDLRWVSRTLDRSSS